MSFLGGPNVNVRFSALSGIQSWANGIALFVNLHAPSGQAAEDEAEEEEDDEQPPTKKSKVKAERKPRAKAEPKAEPEAEDTAASASSASSSSSTSAAAAPSLSHPYANVFVVTPDGGCNIVWFAQARQSETSPVLCLCIVLPLFACFCLTRANCETVRSIDSGALSHSAPVLPLPRLCIRVFRSGAVCFAPSRQSAASR
jgi:hypothetical protein